MGFYPLVLNEVGKQKMVVRETSEVKDAGIRGGGQRDIWVKWEDSPYFE